MPADSSEPPLGGVHVAVMVEPPPSPLKIPRFTIYLYWHPRWDSDPGHRWLREQAAEIGAEL